MSILTNLRTLISKDKNISIINTSNNFLEISYEDQRFILKLIPVGEMKSPVDKMKSPKDEVRDELVISEKTKGKVGSFREQISDYIQLCSKYVLEGSRRPNFPESLSENIACLILTHKFNKKFYRVKDVEKNKSKVKSGDVTDGNIRVEIKCLTSKGPSSFGPTEKWDQIMFIDLKKYENYYLNIYLINLSNTDETWGNIHISKTETFRDQCESGKRPRISFDKIKEQIGDYIELIYSGSIDELEN